MRGRIVVASTRRGLALGGTSWHLAAHEPTGYGVRSMCGLVWAEGAYRTIDESGVARPTAPICLNCQRSEAAAYRGRR